MPPETLELVLRGLTLAVWLALPVALGSFVAGALGSVLQAFTTWRDPALTQVPRVLVVALVWAASWPWIADELLAFTRLLWGGA
ncbi:MAG: flagellar biosynthetic protein FliQ [Myxococcales bacterium]|nr:flagellar biosynthetic protein FliQ [Myxococcales bacterium]